LGDFLQASTKELLFTPQKNNAGKLHEYGLGWQVYTKRINGIEEKIIGHSGGAVGARSVWITI
jgi:hypothetical protein